MDSKEKEKVSKFLSLVLRHKPEVIKMQLDINGWADVNDLIVKSQQAGVDLNFETLVDIVDTSEKARFAFNESRNRIRANQGHSLTVDLEFSPVEPPEILYHGTATRFVSSIMETGLRKGERHHVHLSKDLATALSVGKRHGKPHIWKVFSGLMYKAGFQFYISKNGVWLTENVPVTYLEAVEPSALDAE